MEQLEPRPPAAELYDYRQADEGGIPIWLPHNQGDVFKDVELDDGPQGANGYAMLFLHPCTMRGSQGALIGRMTVIEVVPKSVKKPMDEPHYWRHHTTVIPLPDFSGTGNDAYEANLLNMRTVPTSLLSRENRIAVFSDAGRSHMLHRIIFHLTRHAVPTEVLQTSTKRVQTELQLQGDWTMRAWQRCGDLSELQVASVEGEFQEQLNRAWPDAGPEVPETVRDRLYSEDDAESEEAYEYVIELLGTDIPGSVLGRPEA